MRDQPGIRPQEQTLPRVLQSHRGTMQLASFGKWHLGIAPELDGFNAPNVMGWPRYAGSLMGALGSYTDWTKTSDGVQSHSQVYATTDVVDDAIDWLDGRNVEVSVVHDGCDGDDCVTRHVLATPPEFSKWNSTICRGISDDCMTVFDAELGDWKCSTSTGCCDLMVDPENGIQHPMAIMNQICLSSPGEVDMRLRSLSLIGVPVELGFTQ